MKLSPIQFRGRSGIWWNSFSKWEEKDYTGVTHPNGWNPSMSTLPVSANWGPYVSGEHSDSRQKQSIMRNNELFSFLGQTQKWRRWKKYSIIYCEHLGQWKRQTQHMGFKHHFFPHHLSPIHLLKITPLHHLHCSTRFT